MSGNSNPHDFEPDAQYYSSIMQKISLIKNKDKDQQKQSISHPLITQKIQDIYQPLGSPSKQSVNEGKRLLSPKKYSVVQKKIIPNNYYQDEKCINAGDSVNFSEPKQQKQHFLLLNINQQGKTNKNNEQKSEDSSSQNPKIRAYREKILLKNKSIEELKNKIEKIEKKSDQLRKQQQQKIRNQRKIIMNLLNENYRKKIYCYGLKEIQDWNASKNNFQVQYLNLLTQKIQVLKGEKAKRKKNRISDQESNFYMQDYGGDRVIYLKQWKKKYQAQKNSLQRQLSKKTVKGQFFDEVCYHQLPDKLLNEFGDRKLFLCQHFPLYTKMNLKNLKDGQPYEIRSMNINTFLYQNISFVKFPKLMRMNKRKQLSQRIQNLFEESQNLNRGKFNQILIPYTFFHKQQNQQMVIGRQCSWQVDKTVSLRDHMIRYQVFNQILAKYIIKFVLKAHTQVKNKTKYQAIILPQNIIFSDRNDIRIDNWINNQIYRYNEYRQFLKYQDKCLYFPPEFIAQSNYDMINGTFGCWTIGVIFYELLFGKKPFQFSINIQDSQQFFILNQAVIPQKPQVSDQAKQFLKYCFAKPQQRLLLQKALKHDYFHCK